MVQSYCYCFYMYMPVHFVLSKLMIVDSMFSHDANVVYKLFSASSS